MNTKITFVELVDLMSEATSTTKRVCELFLRELFNTVSQALIEGETVKINGIGTFKVSNVKSRKSVNVSTGEAVNIMGYKKITFTPDKALAAAVNKPFEQFETVVLNDAVTDEELAAIDEKFSVEPVIMPKEEPKPSPAVQAEPVKPVDEKIPEAPLPLDLPEMDEAAPAPAPDASLMPQPEPKKEVKPEPAPTAPAEKAPAPEAAKAKPLERKPMLVGIPIDGPTQPRPESEPKDEPEPERYFYRPAPRNAYSPTEEQLEQAARKPKKRLWWVLLAVLAAGALLWLLTRGHEGSAPKEPEPAVVLADSDSILIDSPAESKPAAESEPSIESKVSEAAKSTAEEKSSTEFKTSSESSTTSSSTSSSSNNKPVVTDIVTSQIVLTTLSEKHYGSPWFWVYIYEENKDIISNPNNIRPGTRVVIPPAEKYGINPKDPKSLKKAQRLSWELLK